jgi:hypothetical protein
MEAVPSKREDVLFVEVQQLRQAWVWALALPSSLLVLGLFAWGITQQIFLGRPWGDRPMSDARLFLIALCGSALAVGLPWTFRAMRLVVQVRRGHLYVRFFPFVSRTLPLEQIARREARLYYPIREYGGWGVRYGGKERGWAYTVGGNIGVQVELKNGERILIGSRRAEELVSALEQAKEN